MSIGVSQVVSLPLSLCLSPFYFPSKQTSFPMRTTMGSSCSSSFLDEFNRLVFPNALIRDECVFVTITPLFVPVHESHPCLLWVHLLLRFFDARSFVPLLCPLRVLLSQCATLRLCIKRWYFSSTISALPGTRVLVRLISSPSLIVHYHSHPHIHPCCWRAPKTDILFQPGHVDVYGQSSTYTHVQHSECIRKILALTSVC